jgi:hypothetical protein
MFTPEFASDERGEFVLVANHSLGSEESVQMSIAYNKARIAFGSSHLPVHFKQCRIIYDIRGQALPEATINRVGQAFAGICNLEFNR